ncbi:serine hydrolase domain-containing protein [Streptomyces blattellae]|uniref:serine hydrolase domain-containing protein n=1 Tax=Streptomyces blattellae TaxID=2569855 RepID=UPI0012B7A1B0|nr:serine hydrolase domain-containing protein [Streptomyces blattellae]
MSPDLTTAAREVLDTGGPGQRPAGVCLGVATPATGTVLAAAGYAMRPDGATPGDPMATRMLFDLASVTKVAATTAVAMRLTAAGRLDLDAPVSPHLTGFRGGDKDRVTAADLLAHRAGLIPWWPLYCQTTDRETALDLAERLPLQAPPGHRRTYSDVGFQLLGRIVERITGTGLATAFQQWVAQPLGLTRTRYGPVDPAAAAVSADDDRIESSMVRTGEPYPVPFTTADFAGWRTTAVRGTAADGNAAHALAGVSGHAGLFAPLDELLGLGAALVHDEAFVPAAVRSRFTAAADSRDLEQGLGFRRFELATPNGPVPMVGHGGFTGTHLAAATDRPLVMAVAATRLHGTRGARADLVPVDVLAHRGHLGIVRSLTQADAFPSARPGRPLTARTPGSGTPTHVQESP